MNPLIKTSLLTLAALTVALPAFAAVSTPEAERTAVTDCAKSAEAQADAKAWSKEFKACLKEKDFKLTHIAAAKAAAAKETAKETGKESAAHKP